MSRIKLEMPDVFVFSTTLPVRISDINYGNHLANDAILAIIHEARVQFLTSLGYSEMNVAGPGIIMGDVAIVYKTQAYYGDTLKIKIAVSDFSRKSCDFFYQINKQDDRIVALAKTGIVFFDYTSGKPVRIPEEFLLKLHSKNNAEIHRDY